MTDVTYIKLREKDCNFGALEFKPIVQTIASKVNLSPYWDTAIDNIILFPTYMSPHNIALTIWKNNGCFDKERERSL